MKFNNNLRGTVRSIKHIRSNKKPDFKRLLGSYMLTGIVKQTMIKKRPRWANLFIGRNRY